MHHDEHDARDGHEAPKGFVVIVTIVAFVVLVAAVPAQVFRDGVYTVQFTATVTDASGRLITGLQASDFEVFEDGDPQPITHFSDERVPVSLGVLLDASDSMRGQAMADARAAVDRFIGELLEPGDQAFVGTFNHMPRIIAPWTQPPSRLREALEGQRPSGGTAMYDALMLAAPEFSRRAHMRAALVVVSDGADTASDHTLTQARDLLRRTDAFLYAVAIDAPDARASTRVNPAALRDLTGPTGGYTEIVRSAADVAPATERIARELNSQYTLGYSSARVPDGSYRLIRVRVKGEGRFVRARRGYYAYPRGAAAPGSF
jgi:Ca-activated chloride channel family protein